MCYPPRAEASFIFLQLKQNKETKKSQERNLALKQKKSQNGLSKVTLVDDCA